MAPLCFAVLCELLAALGLCATFGAGALLLLPSLGSELLVNPALGAWLGPGQTVWLAAFSAIAGGVFALVVALATGYAKQAFINVWALLGYWKVMGLKPHPGMNLDVSRTPKVPYALPIAAGLVMTLWLR